MTTIASEHNPYQWCRACKQEWYVPLDGTHCPRCNRRRHKWNEVLPDPEPHPADDEQDTLPGGFGSSHPNKYVAAVIDIYKHSQYQHLWPRGRMLHMWGDGDEFTAMVLAAVYDLIASGVDPDELVDMGVSLANVVETKVLEKYPAFLPKP